MPKYKVTISEVINYRIEVEADDEDQAAEDAVEILVDAEDTDSFFTGVDEREVTGVELAE